MRTTEESIDALARAVQSEAKADVDQILADARAKAQIVQQHAQEQAASERTQILEQATQEAQRIRSQAVAAAQLKARTLQLERRELLLNSVFAAVRQQLAAVHQSPDYEQIVRRLLREALIHLGADRVQVRADEQTQILMTDQLLAEISKEMGMQVQRGAPLKEGTGLVVETKDGHRYYDNTLEARLN